MIIVQCTSPENLPLLESEFDVWTRIHAWQSDVRDDVDDNKNTNTNTTSTNNNGTNTNRAKQPIQQLGVN